MANDSRRGDIVLESEGLSLHGRRVNDLDWYEFDACVGGKNFTDIGGENRRIVLDRLTTVLAKPGGITLGEIENGFFNDLVGGDTTQYLGYLVVSGYNTFYFFQRENGLRHVVFADREGTVLAHAGLQPGFSEAWLKTLSALRLATGE